MTSPIKSFNKPVTLTRGILTWFIIAGVMSTMTVTILGVLYTNSVQKDSDVRFQKAKDRADHRWCALFSIIDTPSQAATIKDPAQRKRAEMYYARIHELNVEHGCVPK